MEISDNGLAIVKQFEGLRLSAYQDTTGIWTIGYGTTQAVHAGLVISQQQATDWLRAGMANIASYINAVVTAPINQDMFDALASFTYNVGQGNLRKSSVLRLINIGDYLSAADGFLLWTKAGGIMVPGLATRRAMERALFLRGARALIATPPAVSPQADLPQASSPQIDPAQDDPAQDDPGPTDIATLPQMMRRAPPAKPAPEPAPEPAASAPEPTPDAPPSSPPVAAPSVAAPKPIKPPRPV